MSAPAVAGIGCRPDPRVDPPGLGLRAHRDRHLRARHHPAAARLANDDPHRRPRLGVAAAVATASVSSPHAGSPPDVLVSPGCYSGSGSPAGPSAMATGPGLRSSSARLQALSWADVGYCSTVVLVLARHRPDPRRPPARDQPNGCCSTPSSSWLPLQPSPGPSCWDRSSSISRPIRSPRSSPCCTPWGASVRCCCSILMLRSAEATISRQILATGWR